MAGGPGKDRSGTQRAAKAVVLLLGLGLLSACNSGPYPGIGIGVNRHGVSAYPHLSGNVGGVGVSLGGLIN